MLSWLRDFTDLPLGVYPNLGYLSAAGWRHDTAVEHPDFAELALAWREEGAQIIGGCCGVGPERIAAARSALAGTRPGHRRIAQPSASQDDALAARAQPRGLDGRRRRPAAPAAVPRHRRRGGRRRPRPGEPAGLEAPPARSARRGPALPRHRLRIGPADGRAGARRRHPRARDRLGPGRGREHADERVPQRRRGAGQRRGRRPLPVGPRGALRPDRRDAVADPARPVRAAASATGRSTTGDAT